MLDLRTLEKYKGSIQYIFYCRGCSRPGYKDNVSAGHIRQRICGWIPNAKVQKLICPYWEMSKSVMNSESENHTLAADKSREHLRESV